MSSNIQRDSGELWVKRVEQLRQMVSDVDTAPASADDIEYYVGSWDLYDDEREFVRQEFQRQYGDGESTALEQAQQAVESASDGAPTPIPGTTIVVGIDDDGNYWVSDNGDETGGLTKDEAIELVVEFMR